MTPAPDIPARKAPQAAGIVEAVGSLFPGEIFISGWASRDFQQGAPVVALSGDARIEGRMWLCRFDRPDVGRGAGFSGVVELSSDMDIAQLAGLAARDAFLPLYQAVRRVEPAEAVAALQGALQAASNGEQPAILLRVAAAFTGSDTLSGTVLPVRVGIDDCAAIGERGVLVAGWIFDPERLVTSVHLENASGSAELDGNWVRQPRPDVSASMAADPRFAGYPGEQHAHGFVALADLPGDRERLRLALDIPGVAPLYLPLVPRAGQPLALLGRFLRSIPPAAPSSLDMVDRLVAPVLAALPAQAPVLAGAEDRGFPQDAPVALVIGCSGDCEDVPALLALLATDPAMRRVPLVLAADRPEFEAWRGHVERAAFAYGIALRLAYGDGVCDALDALSVGVAACRSDTLCLMTMDVVPAMPGWLFPMLETLRRSPGQTVVRPAIDNAGPRFGCYVLARSAFDAAGMPSGAFLGMNAKVRDFRERLESAGARIVEQRAARMESAAPAGGGAMMLVDRADRLAAALRRQEPAMRKAG